MAHPLVNASNISKSYGLQNVLDNVSFQINEGEKIALIGRNGAGKSTLLKILTQEITEFEGNFELFDRTRIGVVKQVEALPADVSVLAYLEDKTGKPEWEVKKLCSKFGLVEDYLTLSPDELSGGYQMRVKLAALFLMEPNLLFLDEPVNYLDLQTLMMLERVLQDYKGSFVIVAHDRTFLEATCTSVYEIERGNLRTYRGRVSEYLNWKQEQLEMTLKVNKKLKREAKHHQEFVDRFGAKAKFATRAQSKAKHIAKLRSQIVKVDADLATTKIRIQSPKVHAGVALRTEELEIGYEDRCIAKDVNLTVMRGEKVVIVGENGLGKSTLLKTLVGALKPRGGSFKWWKHADIGYYDQMTSKGLSDRATVLSHLESCAPSNASAEQILMMAGNFLFRGEALDKRISVLSGGERARLALAGVLLKSHTVLILDEPTNHMDVETSEGLALALKEYTGTLLFVSHARTFVSALADKIFEVKEGTVREWMSSYDDYAAHLNDLANMHMQDDRSSGGMTSALKELDRQKRKEFYAKRKQLMREISKAEEDMQSFDKEKSSILKWFFDHPSEYDPEKSERLSNIDRDVISIENEWTSKSEELETITQHI